MIFRITSPAFGKFFTVPASAVENYISLASSDHFKVLLCALCSNSDIADTEVIAAQTGLSPQTAEEAMLFWTAHGVIKAAPEDSSGTAAAPVMQPVAAAPAAAALPEKKPEEPDVKPKKKEKNVKVTVRYTPKELAQRAEEDSEISDLFEQMQRVLGKTINNTEAAGYLNLYEYYGYSVPSLLILAQFARNVGKYSMAYVEKVAKDWYSRGITDYSSVEKEIERLTDQSKTDNRIKKALGIEGKLTPEMEGYFEQWCAWGFDVETIDLAGQRCRNEKSKNSLSYINGILRKWHEKGLLTTAAVRESEKRFSENKKTAAGNDTSFSVSLWQQLAEGADPDLIGSEEDN